MLVILYCFQEPILSTYHQVARTIEVVSGVIYVRKRDIRHDICQNIYELYTEQSSIFFISEAELLAYVLCINANLNDFRYNCFAVRRGSYKSIY